MRIGIACGGTGGHIFPGLAVAKILQERRHDVVLWLAGRDVESVSVSGWNGKVISTGGRGLPSGLSCRSFVAAFSLLFAFLKALVKMSRNSPDVLLAMGGYGSVGPVLAARMLGIPVVLHEANAIPGRTIEKLSRCASVVAVSFPSTASYIRHPNIVMTGFPLRREMTPGREDGSGSGKMFSVLVTGGSQGAHRLNEIAVKAICRLHLQGIPVQVLHLSGTKDEAFVRGAYEGKCVKSSVVAFLNDMAATYRQADIVVSRAGAATCAEIVAMAVPAVLVPLPTAMRDHQTANADSLARSGGVVVMPERDLSPEKLSDFIRECYRNPEKLDKMKESLKNIPSINAAERLAIIVETTGRNSLPTG